MFLSVNSTNQPPMMNNFLRDINNQGVGKTLIVTDFAEIVWNHGVSKVLNTGHYREVLVHRSIARSLHYRDLVQGASPKQRDVLNVSKRVNHR